MEDLLAIHRKQLRDLQSQITQKKKSATKKTRRGVNDECERLERELRERQRKEIASLEAGGSTDSPQNGDINSAAADGEVDLDTLTLNDDDSTTDTTTTTTTMGPPQSKPPTTTPDTTSSPPKKPSRQKARLARRAAEITAQSSAAATEALSQPDQRRLERNAISRLLTSMCLTEHEVRSDGHCMYSAVAHSLNLNPNADRDPSSPSSPSSSPPQSSSWTYPAIRQHTAAYIADHRALYEPFIAAEAVSEDAPAAAAADDTGFFDAYVRRIRDTAEWGGELELSAIAAWTGRPVVVVQSEGGVREIGGASGANGTREAGSARGPKAPIYLAYYRKRFGLGEHYNALEKSS